MLGTAVLTMVESSVCMKNAAATSHTTPRRCEASDVAERGSDSVAAYGDGGSGGADITPIVMAAYRFSVTPLARVATGSRFEVMHEPHFKPVRQPSEDQGGLAMRGPDARAGTDRPADQHVGLPVPVHLHARDRVVQRQQFQRVHCRMIVAVLDHERRHR